MFLQDKLVLGNIGFRAGQPDDAPVSSSAHAHIVSLAALDCINKDSEIDDIVTSRIYHISQ